MFFFFKLSPIPRLQVFRLSLRPCIQFQLNIWISYSKASFFESMDHFVVFPAFPWFVNSRLEDCRGARVSAYADLIFFGWSRRFHSAYQHVLENDRIVLCVSCALRPFRLHFCFCLLHAYVEKWLMFLKIVLNSSLICLFVFFKFFMGWLENSGSDREIEIFSLLDLKEQFCSD